MDLSNLPLAYWLLLILAILFGCILGYFFGRKTKGSPMKGQLHSLEQANSALQKELENCMASNREWEHSGMPEQLPFDPVSARKALGRKVTQDDLKIIEGIGPKIEGLFHNYDIKTWQALSGLTVSKCQEVLDSGGDRFRVHDPASWPMQAKMAAEGKWKDLSRWQQEHLHGKL
jgi:predicted flap endonuclease-1-like 5' DNA nuclease